MILIATLLCGLILVDGTLQNTKSHVFTRSDKGLSFEDARDWWKSAVIYQIYPRSFKDSDNDGNGDLQGIIQKLDHISDMDVDAIWLNPIFKSPQVDNGYDISDYRDIDPMYGTLDDLRQLINEAHKLNIKVLLDYVPNHTSDQHEWFQASLKQDPKYDDYYIWRNATYVDGERKPPNNWISHFRGSAWEWNEGRQQYYFHQFSTGQPDLNYRNPVVVEEMKDVLRYWLHFGADGFRMAAVGTLFEDDLLRDEPEFGTPGVDPDDHDYLNHTYTLDQPESFDMIYQWRDLVDDFNRQNSSYTRVMITEGNSKSRTVALFYGNRDLSRLGAHFSFNFISFITHLQKNYDYWALFTSLRIWFDDVPSSRFTSNWVLGNHDNTRISTRLGVENIDTFNIFAAMLPGALVTYQGEEIGQENGEVTCEEGTDPRAIKNCTTFDTVSRDFERTPYQWDNSTNAGFNDGAKSWLPVSKKYVETNLAQQNIADVNSHYNVYKRMVELRREFKNSSIDKITYGWNGGTIFYAQRITDNANYKFYCNTGDSVSEFGFTVRTVMTIVARSQNSDYALGDIFTIDQPLKAREAIIGKVINE